MARKLLVLVFGSIQSSCPKNKFAGYKLCSLELQHGEIFDCLGNFSNSKDKPFVSRVTRDKKRILVV